MKEAKGLEEGVGIGCYASSGPSCAARAKSYPEDFRVEERLLTLDVSEEELPGYFPLYRVEKRSVDTMHMSKELAVVLKSRVSYAGLKDKRAVAVQYLTPTSIRGERPKEVQGEGFAATRVGFVRHPLSRSSVAGNTFEITLRECCPDIGARVAEVIRLGEAKRLPNFYGLQRFGVSGAGSHRIGKAIVRAEFEEAVSLLLEPEGETEAARALKDALAKGDYEGMARLLPPGRDVERLVARELARHGGEWVKALRAIPVRLRRLYVHAYQSSIFNKTLTRAIVMGEDISLYERGDNWAETSEGGLLTLAPRGVRDSPSAGAVPLIQMVGYAYRNYGSRFDRIIEEVLGQEEVFPGQFYVKKMQEVSSEGGFRRPHLVVQAPSWETEDRKAHIRFTLAKGQYATILLREIVKPGDPAAAGLA